MRAFATRWSSEERPVQDRIALRRKGRWPKAFRTSSQVQNRTKFGFSGCPRVRYYLPVSTLIASQSVKFVSMPTMRMFCVPDAAPMASSRVVASKNLIKRLCRSMFFLFFRLPCEPLESNLLALLSYFPKPTGSSSEMKLVIIFLETSPLHDRRFPHSLTRFDVRQAPHRAFAWSRRDGGGIRGGARAYGETPCVEVAQCRRDGGSRSLGAVRARGQGDGPAGGGLGCLGSRPRQEPGQPRLEAGQSIVRRRTSVWSSPRGAEWMDTQVRSNSQASRKLLSMRYMTLP
jgi:hypothetical protein